MTTTILVLARTLHIGSAMLLVAFPYFWLVVVRPVFAADFIEGHDIFFRRIIKWLWAMWFLEGVSGLVWFWFVAAQMSDESPWGILDASDINAVLWQTQFGELWLTRGAVGIVLGGLLYLMTRRKKEVFSRTPSLGDWLVLVISGVLLLTMAWAGHAAAGVRFQVLHLVVDSMHLVMGVVWPIGLIPMACFLGHIRRGEIMVPADRACQVLQRFSQFSLGAVLVLVVTGTINGWLMVGSWEGLVTTTYGRLLAGKILLVGMMIGLGAINRLVVLPRLKTDPALFETLRKTILAESGLALAVLLIVGTMGMTAPPS